MKLDDTVCRGSLIIHKGESYVVTGRSSVWLDWVCLHTPKDGVWIIDGFMHLSDADEVDTFFPGAVFEIPDYIK